MSDEYIPSRKDKRKKGDKKINIVKVIRRSLLIIVLCIVLVSVALSVYLASVIRGIEDFDPETFLNFEQTSFIYDQQGNMVTSVHGVENRIRISLTDVPQHVQDAFVAVEDVRFFDHSGFDIRRMIGALFENIKARALVQGAGTITQQLIRNTLLTKEKTIERKLQEIYLAYQLEKNYSKDQILEMYLNVIYFARGAYGIEAASKTYYGKPTSELTIEEGALLAGIIKHPLRNSPFIDKERSLERKDLTISLMVRYNKLSFEEGETAKKREIEFAEDIQPVLPHGYFIDMVMEEAAQILEIPVANLYTAGYRIYTTLDSAIQNHAENLFGQDDLFPKSPVTGVSSESALVVLDTSTGEIRALLGGREYPANQRGALNRAQKKKSPGSSIKPLVVYGPALENHGYTSVSFIEDAPVDFAGYSPSNFGGRFSGIVNLRYALARSINIPAVKILRDIGIRQGANFAESLGISFTARDKQSLTIALGGMEHGISPLELARAYATFGDGGSYKDYTAILRIEDPYGVILYQYRPVKEKVVSEETAFILNNILESTTREGGTASRLGTLPFRVSAKTGTVQLPPDDKRYAGINGHNDIWSAVYNPEYTITVWMGFDTPWEGADRETPVYYLPPNALGGTFPTEISKRLLSYIYENKERVTFVKPIDVVEVKLDAKALWEEKRVLLATPLTPARYTQREYFRKNQVPKDESDYWRAPDTPFNFTITITEDGYPELAFTPRNTFADYLIYRISAGESTPILIRREYTGSLERITWVDTQVNPGQRYGYFIIPSHRELVIDEEHVQGPPTQTIYIDLPVRRRWPFDDWIIFPPAEETSAEPTDWETGKHTETDTEIDDNPGENTPLDPIESPVIDDP